jgi:hypothetical protein
MDSALFWARCFDHWTNNRGLSDEGEGSGWRAAIVSGWMLRFRIEPMDGVGLGDYAMECWTGAGMAKRGMGMRWTEGFVSSLHVEVEDGVCVFARALDDE